MSQDPQLTSPVKEIRSFSLESLGKMYGIGNDNDLMNRGYFFARHDSESLRHLDFLKYPCRINAFITILCIRGSVNIVHNLKRYTVSGDCFFISIPDSIIQIESWERFEIFITAITEDYTREMIFDNRKSGAMLLSIKNHPFFRLKRDEADSLTRTFHSLTDDMLLFRDQAYSDEILSSSFNLAVYKLFSIISKHQDLSSVNIKSVTSRQEEHYNRFIQLLDRNFKQERSIGFYASEICITPKYLSTLVKEMSGRTAAEWIDGMVVMEAKHLLKYTGMSIKEISEYLNFPNQSFFSRYFRRETGLTPGRYRREP